MISFIYNITSLHSGKKKKQWKKKKINKQEKQIH